jgi:hypothetical protein
MKFMLILELSIFVLVNSKLEGPDQSYKNKNLKIPSRR